MKTNVSTFYRSKPARADSEIDLQLQTQEGKRRVLKIRTYKGNGKELVTHASVDTVDGNCVTHMIFADFSRRVRTAPLMATDRNVRSEHEAALAGLDELLNVARAHYGPPACETSAAMKQRAA